MDVEAFKKEWFSAAETLTVHTSGSTGKPKTMVVEKTKMAAGAHITCSFLGLKPGDTALICLPMDFIAGKMMAVRAWTHRLKPVVVEPSGHPLETVNEPIDFAAMIPTQVYNSLQVPQEAEKLKQVKHLIIGGGAIDKKLEEQLSHFPNAVWSTYGMTETLSHIALRRVNGPQADEYYTPLAGVSVHKNADGCLVIDAPAVCNEQLTTNDLVCFADDNRRFKIIGRKDNVVCSGGIKIHLEEVEEMLRPYVQQPVMATKCTHEKWGEALVLLTTDKNTRQLMDLCRKHLPKYHVPQHILSIEELPYTETGKPARAKAQAWVEKKLKPD